MNAKDKALEKKKKHTHTYKNGKQTCEHEENVEYGKKGGKETGKEDEE